MFMIPTDVKLCMIFVVSSSSQELRCLFFFRLFKYIHTQTHNAQHKLETHAKKKTTMQNDIRCNE